MKVLFLSNEVSMDDKIGAEMNLAMCELKSAEILLGAD